MNNIFDLIKDNTKTFEDFRKWLFIKLNKDVNKFKSIGKSSNKFKVPYLIEYLENKGVNILETLPYYHYKGSSHDMNFETLLIYMIIEEFHRIENNEIINYTPF